MDALSSRKWTNAEIHNLFRLGERIKSRQTLFNAEERGEIPKAHRVPRGSTMVRQWSTEQLPAIGAKFGFLSQPTKPIIICVYTPKGGVLKTSFSSNSGRTFGLNSIKTLIVGLDFQRSATNYILPKPVFSSLAEFEEYRKSKDHRLGLYHFLYEGANLEEVIKKTSIPTLDIIPETPDLVALEKKLRNETRREYVFQNSLMASLNKYQVIIFDCGPSWNQLIECALTAANNVIAPIGCDLECYDALEENLEMVYEFRDKMNLRWDNFILIPTLLEKNKLSQQIYASYLSKYNNDIITTPIRRTIKGQEARVLHVSALEYEPKSELAQDYYEVISEVWKRIVKRETYG